jgi:hypothetical protein
MSSTGSDDDDDDDRLPNRSVTVSEGAGLIDVREVTPSRAEDSEPGQPRLRWRLAGEQTAWEGVDAILSNAVMQPRRECVRAAA